MTKTTTMKFQLVATLSVWCWTACSTTAFVVPKFATARLGVVVEAAQREDGDARSSWGSVAATSAAFFGFTLATSQAAWAQAPLPVVPSISSVTAMSQRSNVGAMMESPSLWMALDTMDFSMPSYSDSVGSSTSSSSTKAPPSFNPFADSKSDSTSTIKEEAAPAPVKESAAERRAADKAAADAKKAEEQAAADAKKAAKEARLQAEKEKQRVALERQRQQPAKEEVVDEKSSAPVEAPVFVAPEPKPAPAPAPAPTPEPAGTTSDLQLPELKLPSFGMPKFDTPKFDVPSFETPKMETPKFDVPKFDTPKFEMPSFDTPKFDSPKFDTPKFDTPKFDTPKFDTPKFDMPSFNTPKFETPKFDFPKLDTPKFDLPSAPQVDAPKFDFPETPKVSLPFLGGGGGDRTVGDSVPSFEDSIDPQEVRDERAREARQDYKVADSRAKELEEEARKLRGIANDKKKVAKELKDIACETRLGGKWICLRPLNSGY